MLRKEDFAVIKALKQRGVYEVNPFDWTRFGGSISVSPPIA
jgi:hypothetical protein